MSWISASRRGFHVTSKTFMSHHMSCPAVWLGRLDHRLNHLSETSVAQTAMHLADRGGLSPAGAESVGKGILWHRIQSEEALRQQAVCR